MPDRQPRRTFGDALHDAFRAEGMRQRSRPPAQSWRAQFNELTRSGRGQRSLMSAGVNPGRSNRNWLAWLAGDREPSKANRERIADAYQRWFGPGFPDMERKTIAIHGRVDMGGDVRDRGNPGDPRARGHHAPLRIDGRGVDWTRLRAAWAQHATPGTLAALFVQDGIGQVLELSFASWPEFPGDAYLVILE